MTRTPETLAESGRKCPFEARWTIVPIMQRANSSLERLTKSRDQSIDCLFILRRV